MRNTVWIQMIRAALIGAFVIGSASVYAVERSLTIEAPVSVKVDQTVPVTISAHTDAEGEQIGFLQVDASTDNGGTWTPVCYLQNSGAKISQKVSVRAGATRSTVHIRARAAFRGGFAGDVDYRGAAILWQMSWSKWETPPAKHVTIEVIESDEG